MTEQPSVVRARLAFVAVCCTVLAVWGWSSPVSAHTDFVLSVPADGSTVDGPISTVTVEFTNPAVESGDGFQLLEPDGTVRAPDAVDPTDGTAFVASFDPPLDAGTYGFRWDVQAGDAHPIQGSFQFTVATSAASATGTSEPAVAPVAPPTATVSVDHSTMDMDEFLADDTIDPFGGRVARTIAMASTVFAAGVIAALAWVIRGRRDEIGRLLVWVRIAGLGLVTGGLGALVVLDETQSTSLADTATTKPGIAALLTMAGGVLVVAGFGPRAGNVVGPTPSLSAAVAVDEAATGRPDHTGFTNSDERAAQFRWIPDASAAVGMAGIALALAAYWFDGHTVSRGPWVLHAAVNLVHVTAASVWVGGVFAMTAIAWMRKRRRIGTDLAEMVVRFSTVAAISLTALAAAGLVMAWLILDTVGDLFSTDWGQVLLVKVAAVAIAAGLGGYNHFVLRPLLETRPEDPEVAAHLRRSLLIESMVMVAVIAATAVLVASST